jgi:hypothetical protein
MTFELLDRDAPVAWRMSEPVPVAPPAAPRALVARAEGSAGPSLEVLRSALAAIPNEGDAALGYDDWRNVVFALHDATDGSDEGLQLAHEFSARAADKYAPEFLDLRVWPYIRSRPGGITAGSLYARAAQHGWSDPTALDDFAVVVHEPEAGAIAPADDAPLPAFERDKTGRVLATLGNITAALHRPDLCGFRVALDTFVDSVMLATPGCDDWRPLVDNDYTRIRTRLASFAAGAARFHEIGRELMRDALHEAAEAQKFDSAQLWLDSLPAHDGVPRVDAFLSDRFSVPDTPYARAVSRYIWTALAGRVIEPGCKVDMVPVLVGPQGAGKSTAVLMLAPHHDFFVEINMHAKDDDLARSMRGKVVGELCELRGFAGRNAEDLKAWVTRRYEEWTPKYRERATKFARRLLLIGTTNDPVFLSDESGHRRWLPVDVGDIDTASIERDRDQLWAEARDLFSLVGVDWSDAERLALHEHDKYVVQDSWVDIVAAWLDTPELDGTKPSARKFLRVAEVGQGALNLNPHGMQRREELRIGKTLRVLGYERRKVRDGERSVWAYRLPLPNVPRAFP